MTNNLFRQALIIGSGMGGLLAARVLSNHFATVTIVERGERPDGPIFRKETPQAAHRHGLTIDAKRLLEQLFPGLDATLAQTGCPTVTLAEGQPHHGADYLLVATETQGVSQGQLGDRIVSRPRLEWEMLQRVEQLPNVQFLWKHQVRSFLIGSDRKNLLGVMIQEPQNKQIVPFEADLVIDGSGRYSKILQWLAEAGYETPSEAVVDPKLIMVAQWYKIPAGFPSDWEGLIIEPRPPYNFRSGMMTKIEGKYFLLTLSGKVGFYPPTRQDALMDYLKLLRRPGIYEALRHAEPLGPAQGYGNTQNRRRYFERLTNFPHNLVVLGDAIFAFNPGHAFGIGIIGQCAEVLQKLLGEQAQAGQWDEFSQQFHTAVSHLIEETWQTTTRADLYDLEQGWLPRLEAPITAPLEDEPHLEAWESYAHAANQTNAFTALQSRFVQLQFPVQAGVSKTQPYQLATRQGAVQQAPYPPELKLQKPEQLQLQLYSSVFGRIPILETLHRADFETLVQAFAKRNELTPIPRAIDTYVIAGLNNWDRIRIHKLRWLAAAGELPPQEAERVWPLEFKRLTANKALYQDRFVIAETRLAHIPAHELGLLESEWQAIWPVIQAEHAAVYYTLPRLLGPLRELSAQTELLGYYVGMVRAIGRFRADWFLRFANPELLQVPPTNQLPFGVRFQNQVAEDQPLWIQQAAKHIAQFDAENGRSFRTPDGLLTLLFTLDSLTLRDLALEDAPQQLKKSLATIQQLRQRSQADFYLTAENAEGNKAKTSVYAV